MRIRIGGCHGVRGFLLVQQANPSETRKVSAENLGLGFGVWGFGNGASGGPE